MTGEDMQNEDRPSLDLTGRQLGDYRILRRLGRGAMAEVYLADQLSLRRQVAVKVLRTNLSKDESYVRRFHNEAQAAAALVHPNIVQIHEVGRCDGIHFIAQEYVAGQNLAQVMQRHGAIDVKLAMTIIRQIASALAKAAEYGIVHRDIKPENIMLARTGEVKVADFGLARFADSSGVDLTQVGVTMGTPLYMSPEQIEGRRLDPRTDIYSLGVTSYHILTGRPPYMGETALAVAVQHVNSSPEPIAESRPDLPPEWARIVHKMLNKKPDDRYASAGDILHDLHRLATSGGLSDPSESAMSAEQWTTVDLGATADLATLNDPRSYSPRSYSPGSDSTVHLDHLMKTEHLMKTSAMLAPPRGRWRRLLLGMAVGAAVGAAVAAVTRSSPLLSAVASPDVPTRQTVWAQLYHAKMTDTEAAWIAVWQRFDNPYTAKLAKQGLVHHYVVQTAEYDKALPLLDELAALGEVDRSFVAFGLAGRCVALHRMNRPDEARAAAARLDSDMKDQLDPQMRRMFDRTVERSRR